MGERERREEEKRMRGRNDKERREGCEIGERNKGRKKEWKKRLAERKIRRETEER
jgi:hypothetical protein